MYEELNNNLYLASYKIKEILKLVLVIDTKVITTYNNIIMNRNGGYDN